MDELMKSRIMEVYPEDLLYEPEYERLYGTDQFDRIRLVIDRFLGTSPVAWHRDLFDQPAYMIKFTHSDSPPFSEWVYKMDTEDKVHWIENAGGSYVVLVLRVSRVVDRFYTYSNVWTHDAKTKRVVPNVRIPLTPEWIAYQRRLHSDLEQEGFEFASDRLLAESTSFILEPDYDGVPDDDPRWDDIDFEPPLVRTIVHSCLFGQY